MSLHCHVSRNTLKLNARVVHANNCNIIIRNSYAEAKQESSQTKRQIGDKLWSN